MRPAYYLKEMPNILMKAAASARPVITTNRGGCRETVDNGVTGYVVPIMQEAPLIDAIERFMCLCWEQRRDMGMAGREKMEREFDRRTVIDKYLDELKLIEGKTNSYK